MTAREEVLRHVAFITGQLEQLEEPILSEPFDTCHELRRDLLDAVSGRRGSVVAVFYELVNLYDYWLHLELFCDYTVPVPADERAAIQLALRSHRDLAFAFLASPDCTDQPPHPPPTPAEGDAAIGSAAVCDAPDGLVRPDVDSTASALVHRWERLARTSSTETKGADLWNLNTPTSSSKPA